MAAASLSPLSPNINEDMETSEKAFSGTGDWDRGKWGSVDEELVGNTVDGSEIPRPTTWDVPKTL